MAAWCIVLAVVLLTGVGIWVIAERAAHETSDAADALNVVAAATRNRLLRLRRETARLQGRLDADRGRR